MDEGWVERDGVRLHYLEWRPSDLIGVASQPALFLLHGLSSNARVWERTARLLGARRIVALDQRSHGLSDRPPTGYALDEVAADAAHVIRELGLGRPLVAGHSWGAAVALSLAAAHPELASGLVNVDGPTASFSRFMTWEEAAQRMQPPLPTYRHWEDAAAAQAEALGDAWGDDLNEFVSAGLVKTPAGSLAPTLTAEVRLQILRELYDFQPELLFASVEGPILLAMAGQLWPGAQAEFIDRRRRSVEEVQELRPDAQVRWY
ncbi:MAG TPA: alpha/beta fold hydrolase, partial [Candidatus Dormibacteraeota bacterium]|nr:alpha/beta fold hydrolase [Candidatus Dormibacteraeota bacterium]